MLVYCLLTRFLLAHWI